MAETDDRKHGDGRPEVPEVSKPPQRDDHKLRIVWFNAIGFLVLHLGAAYGLYLFLTSIMVFTMFWSK